MFIVKFMFEGSLMEAKFTDFDIAISWAITSLSQYNIKWLIRDTLTGNQYLGDTIISSFADKGVNLYPKVYP